MGRIRQADDVIVSTDGEYIINQYNDKNEKVICELKLTLNEADVYSRMLQQKIEMARNIRK